MLKTILVLKKVDNILKIFLNTIRITKNIPIDIIDFWIFRKSKRLFIILFNGEVVFFCKMDSTKGSKRAKLKDSNNAVINTKKNNINTYGLNGFNNLISILINFFSYTYDFFAITLINSRSLEYIKFASLNTE